MSLPSSVFPSSLCRRLLVAGLLLTSAVLRGEIPAGKAGFEKSVAPFFETHCVACHGPDKSKGKITLHTLDGDLSTGRDLERWEHILEMLEAGEMPPEDEDQPDAAERAAVAQWIENGLRDFVQKASSEQSAAEVRRLTNFEYENTMRDLLGFPLKLIDNLPADPSKPYHFQNTAEYMRLGPEQLDRYLECARRVMASAIVDPEMPEVHKHRREWPGHGIDRGLAWDEVGVWGNRRHSVAHGMGLKTFPQTGEFRIRIKTSAILPPGIEEIPLRLIMGYGIQINSATERVEPVGTVRLSNSPDEARIVEFRGRMENFPAKPGRPKNGVPTPPTMTITPQNLYDDGTLNDGNRNLAFPRAVIEWLEFEAPITDVWPPEHHTKILFDSPLRENDEGAYVSEVLRRFMGRAYRRPATDDEVERYGKVYELVRPDLGTLEAAMRETLSMVLISPPFLLHTVADEEVVSADYEVASRLSYFLWGSMPDDELLALAAKGELSKPEIITAQAKRLLADSRSADFVESFTRQWLSLDKMKTVPINQDLFPRFLYYVSAGERRGTEVPYLPTIRDHMIGETVGFVGELIRRNEKASAVVDSNFAMLNQPLAAHYGVEGVRGDLLRPVPVKPEHHLGGLLTQGSILIGNGTGTAPHPIYRAVWLREAILGDEVAPPPADVPALSDSAGDSAEKALTIKNLLAAHREKESCNDCHVRLDPWGIPFERYNAIGQYQPMVPKEGVRVSGFTVQNHKDLPGYRSYLKTLFTEEVEARARVPHGPSVDGIAELKAHLVKDRSDEIAENLMRRLLTYSLGRPLTYQDRFAVEELLSQTKAEGHRLEDMILAICRSELFQN